MTEFNDRRAHTFLTSLNEATFANPRERAMFHLVHRGVLIVDDNASQLQALYDVCFDFLEIPERNIRTVHIDRTASIDDIATTLGQAFRDHLKALEAPFASIITDYNFTPDINSIDVWKIVEARLSEEPIKTSWLATGRVLVTADDRNSSIVDAERNGLIDAYLHKPLKLTSLSAALCESVLKRIS